YRLYQVIVHASFVIFLTATLPMFFFSNSLVAPRVLHSFPTRRSSDLADERLEERGQDALQKVAGVGAGGLHDGLGGGESAHGCGDRKSTRLNSSHVKISYAVFCLKKKI